MDIEQLKLVLDTVSAVSGDAKGVAIAYLAINGILPTIGWMVALTLAYRLLVPIVRAYRMDGQLRLWRDSLGIGSRGYLSSEETHKTINKINALIASATKE